MNFILNSLNLRIAVDSNHFEHLLQIKLYEIKLERIYYHFINNSIDSL